ncbi:uncharacterized protein L3040_007071 [Drepanopeziza brunnea f. sp. 'multigermtubi']|uniref:uncharacterized protein n=1 Tax=Drepanopeziza brunnea f. sp. 'multigermtubi' TaxID=698441 RepID=UPI00239C7AC9|nr:hypothetical protein L3040_007071 [Drepanopeziza brunnea f. sp. 'multigermtubi']
MPCGQHQEVVSPMGSRYLPARSSPALPATVDDGDGSVVDVTAAVDADVGKMAPGFSRLGANPSLGTAIGVEGTGGR